MPVTITPDLPYFAAAADCDWPTARRVAAGLSDDHVAAVDRAEALAFAEAATGSDLVICRSADGWSLHAPGSTDDEIAGGDSPPLADGPGNPTPADYRRALAVLVRRAAA